MRGYECNRLLSTVTSKVSCHSGTRESADALLLRSVAGGCFGADAEMLSQNPYLRIIGAADKYSCFAPSPRRNRLKHSREDHELCLVASDRQGPASRTLHPCPPGVFLHALAPTPQRPAPPSQPRSPHHILSTPRQRPSSLKLTAHSLDPRRAISIRGEFRGLVQQAVSVGAPASNMHSHLRRCAYGNNLICWADSDRACS
jgi:hypothetical protein